ncbi:hypothetical protein ANN_00908 [Periplaneta americana]|uniref:Uncharacterized protein n=1 Tax=Periplaneta americana TaxID=6978 RepID=A0ABQ8TUJ0_PERAM|nr:hypothetical protein ANN_00908 [Periplaneta americana]
MSDGEEKRTDEEDTRRISEENETKCFQAGDRSHRPNPWPPPSPDLTPLTSVYSTKPLTIPELVERIDHTIQMVTPDMLTRVHEELIRRLHLCIQQKGDILKMRLNEMKVVMLVKRSPGSNTESYPAFAHIGLKETPEKPQPGNLPQLGIEPGHFGFVARRLAVTPQVWTTKHSIDFQALSPFSTCVNGVYKNLL